MKKNKKILLAVSVLLFLMTGLSGCGKSDRQEEQPTGSVYVPEYAEFAIDCDYVREILPAGDEAFVCVDFYDDETGEGGTAVYRYDLAANEAEKLEIDLGENSNIFGMALDADGNLILGRNQDDYTMDDEGNVTSSERRMELLRISVQDGAVLDTGDVTELFQNSEYAYVQYFCADSQGNLYLCDGEGSINVVGKDFQKLCEIKSDSNWINAMVTSREGEVYVALYGEKGMELRKVDLAGKKLDGAISGTPQMNGSFNLYTGIKGSFLISTSSQVYSYDLASAQATELFNWIDVDVNGENISNVGELSDGRIFAITRDYSTGGRDFELIYLSLKDASQVAAKEEITFGTMWMDSDLRKNIINFNKTSDKYRIKVKEYGTDDYETGRTQFNADLTTENCPDIIDLSSLDFHQYASKGILEDLYPYMEKSAMNKEDYLENILGAYEIDGKLYGILSKFYVSTTMAKTSLVGDVTGWTLSEMLDFAEARDPENLFQYGSRSSILYYCIYNNIDEFIDWETGQCSFEGEEFIRTLEFAAKYPEEPDFETTDEREGIASLLHSDRVLLMQTSLSSVQEYQMMNGLFGEKAAYIGYPNQERKGNLIQPASGSMGLSAKSGHKEGAWEFMKTILSEEYQEGLLEEHGSWGFPVKKSALEHQFEIDMTPEYYEDEEGNQVENPKTTWGYDDFEMEIMAATKEETDAVRALIMSADKISGVVDEQLMNIIAEESEPFFKGQKSAADAAKIIQNRIQIYVNENR